MILNASSVAEPILVGREPELAQLQHFLDSAIAGEGATVFVSGEAGSGKTRITHEFLFSAKDKAQVLSGWCLNNAPVPFFPFIEAFESFLAESESDRLVISERSGLSWLMASTQTVEKGLSPETAKDQKFAALAKELLNMSTAKPLILFIDDLHWADSASLSLIQYLSRLVKSEKILVLATFRSEELNCSAEGFANPLQDTLRLMGREDLFFQINLPNLNRSNVSRIAQCMLGGKVNEALVDWITNESQGNPLFVVESLKLLFENGSLKKESGEWELKVDQPSIPLKIKDIILRRLSNLKANQRRTLDVASVIGDKFDPQLLGSILEVDSLAVLEMLNSIALSKSLVSVEGDYYRFDHAKTREVLYDEILLPLRKGYHQRVAEKIEALASNQMQLPFADLAYHYTQGGNLLKSIQYSNAAGKDALARFSNAEAIKYFTYVVEALQQNSHDLALRSTALEGLGDACYASMRFKDASKAFDELAEVGGDVKLRALRKSMEASFFQNDLKHLQELLCEADKTSSTDRLEIARIWMNKGRVCTLQGNLLEGNENRRKALQVFEEECSLSDVAWCLISLGTNLPGSGAWEESVAHLLRSVAIFQELKDTRWLIEALNMAGITLGVFFGYGKEGMDLVEKSIKLNQDSKIGDYLRLSQSYAIASWILSGSSDYRGAIAKSITALSFAEKTDSYWGMGTAYANLTIQHTLTGDLNRAEEYFGKLMKLPPEIQSNAMVNAPIATALLFAGKKQFEKSNQIFEMALARLKTQPNPGIEMNLRMSYAWALSQQQQFQQAQEQVTKTQELKDEIGKRFEHVNLHPFLMAPTKASTDHAFEIRLDLVSPSKEKGLLVRIQNLPSDFKVLTIPSDCTVQNGAIEFKECSLEPFSTVTVKLIVQALKEGIFELQPTITYKPETGENKTAKTKQIKITVSNPHRGQRIEFESEISGQIFTYLANAYNKDYAVLGLTQERSGWRTLMDIVKEGKIPKNRIYAPSSRYSSDIARLKRQGLIEVRLFEGERGRGGKVTKLRVAYEKEAIKQFIR